MDILELKLKYEFYSSKIDLLNDYLKTCSKKEYEIYFSIAKQLIKKADMVIKELQELGVKFDLKEGFKWQE